MTTTTDERLARLEARVADQDRTILHLIAERAALALALGTMRQQLVAGGYLDAGHLEGTADAIIAAFVAGRDRDDLAFARTVRATLDVVLSDPVPGRPSNGAVH